MNCDITCIDANNINQAIIMANQFYKEPSSRADSTGVKIRGDNFSMFNIITNNVFVNPGDPKNNTAPFRAIVLQGNSQHTLCQGNVFQRLPISAELAANPDAKTPNRVESFRTHGTSSLWT
ncbi:hypothetical protein WJX72_002262 [[Myrmecia] bisecta]|uniref:Uncharacterized protein n=1 Tax=[Myrmecia] bisecta TaxID=41462 RepID=A0AAW1R5E0_9CHLO